MTHNPAGATVSKTTRRAAFATQAAGATVPAARELVAAEYVLTLARVAAAEREGDRRAVAPAGGGGKGVGHGV